MSSSFVGMQIVAKDADRRPVNSTYRENTNTTSRRAIPRSVAANSSVDVIPTSTSDSHVQVLKNSVASPYNIFNPQYRLNPKPQLNFKYGHDNFARNKWYPSEWMRETSPTWPADSIIKDFIKNGGPYSPDVIPLRKVNPNNAIWVNTKAAFNAMLEDLESVSVIGVDVENHNYRTFRGFICLVQLSTQHRDYLVDVLDPIVRHQMSRLRPLFINPRIVKVFHDASMDVIWLQRDFQIFVVAMFDTKIAWDFLMKGESKSSGLGHLLKVLCGFDADKKYTNSDWRLRPLPQELLYYAQADSHYLPFLHYRLSQLLLQSQEAQTSTGGNPLGYVFNKSAKTCLKRYDREPYEGSEGGCWTAELLAWPSDRRLCIKCLRVYLEQDLRSWRDVAARTEDESPWFIMTEKILKALTTLKHHESALELPELQQYWKRPRTDNLKYWYNDLARILAAYTEMSEKASCSSDCPGS